jgi:hypothetical protein
LCGVHSKSNHAIREQGGGTGNINVSRDSAIVSAFGASDMCVVVRIGCGVGRIGLVDDDTTASFQLKNPRILKDDMNADG